MPTSPLLVAILLALTASQASAAVYDLAGDFSNSSNPDGAWSYGYGKSLGDAFTIESKSATTKGVDYWKPRSGGNPFTSHNDTDGAVTIGTTTWQANMVVSHPGALGEFQINRLTLIDAGDYQLSGSFLSVDSHGANADVHVLANGVSIFSDLVFGHGDTSRADFSLAGTFAANTTLDFVVGTGDGNYLFDAVAVDAHISPVPEPATYLMWGLGLLALVAARPTRKALVPQP